MATWLRIIAYHQSGRKTPCLRRQTLNDGHKQRLSVRIQRPLPASPFVVEPVTGSAATTGTSMARFAAQRSCIRADNFARVSTESFRFCRPGGTDAAVGSAFPRIKAFFGRGDVLDAARFTLRINLERRLASFCMLASSFSSFRLKFFNVIIYNSSFP